MHAFPLNFPRTDDEENPHPELFNRGNVLGRPGQRAEYICECPNDHPSALKKPGNNQEGSKETGARDALFELPASRHHDKFTNLEFKHVNELQDYS